MSKMYSDSNEIFLLKTIVHRICSLKLYFIAVISICVVHIFSYYCPAQTQFSENKRKIFENRLTTIAERYVGIPYKLGGHPEQDGMIDNSHLFCMIYEKAGWEAGLKFRGYMPMALLLKNTHQIPADELRKGDLIVLNDGHAAMIYNLESLNNFDLIYASFKRKEVISFNSRNVIYEVFWLKHLHGFFRLNSDVFIPLK